MVMPSMTLWIKLYLPIGIESGCAPTVGVSPPDLDRSHVSTLIFTSSNDNVIGTLLSFAHDIRNEMWLHQADVSLNQDGNSKSSVSTFSSNWRLDSSPSPLKVEMLILSLDRFLVYLKDKIEMSCYGVGWTVIVITYVRCQTGCIIDVTRIY